MDTFKIITENTIDMPDDYVNEHGIGVMHLSYSICEVQYGINRQLDWKEFYRLMREGNMPKTSQINPDEARKYLLEYIQETNNLLYVGFSSGLSGSFNSVRIAANEIMEENPQVNILMVDTKAASMGEGLLLHKAVVMKEQGKSMEEIYQWLKNFHLNLVHIFTVDDLNHLYRGGRVSKTTAIIGTIAGIKPILHVDEDGKLVPISKVRGRKKSLIALVDYMEEKIGKFEADNDIIFISHGDAYEDAEFVQEEVKNRFGIDNAMLNHIGPSIGAHSGPGTIALFFMGNNR